MNERLYAWKDLSNYFVGDHTWITTYEPGSGDPDPDRGDYWYCWGDPHFKCELIEIGEGGVDFARSIAVSHDPCADVGIKYLRDGLCHQMANRLLRFSFGADGQPVTVKTAKGYQLSVAMYGEYGGKRRLLNSKCGEMWDKIVSEYINRKEDGDERK